MIVNVGAAFLALSALAGAQTPMGVCEALKYPVKGPGLIKGVGQLTKEGLIMGDPACPVFKLRRTAIPSAVMVTVRSFSSDDVRRRFSRIRPSISSPLLTVVVRGKLDCKTHLDFQVSDDGVDVVAGNGFGQYGFWKCRMENGRLETFEILKARE